MVLADSCRGFNLATLSSSVSYHECVRNHACQEGRNFAPVHATCPCACACGVYLGQDSGSGMTCFSLSCPCDRTMFECILVLSYFLAVSFSWVSPELRIDAPPAVPYICFPVSFSTLLTGRYGCNCLYLN